jgi:hypothetical protein
MNTKKLLSVALGAMMLCPGMKAEIGLKAVGQFAGGYFLGLGAVCCGGLGWVVASAGRESDQRYRAQIRPLEEKVKKGELIREESKDWDRYFKSEEHKQDYKKAKAEEDEAGKKLIEARREAEKLEDQQLLANSPEGTLARSKVLTAHTEYVKTFVKTFDSKPEDGPCKRDKWSTENTIILSVVTGLSVGLGWAAKGCFKAARENFLLALISNRIMGDGSEAELS